MKRFFRFFLQGLILFIPLIITLAVLVKLFDFFVGLFAFAGLSTNPILNTLLGLLFTLGFIALLGLLASSFVFRRLFGVFEEKLEHAPFIRHIYSPVKDLINAFVGNKKRFNRPVLVKTGTDIQEIGFVTSDDLRHWNIHGKVAVYLPFSYSFAGKVLIVPADKIEPLNAVSAEAMKFVVSGGLTQDDREL